MEMDRIRLVTFFRDLSIQNKMLVIIMPLIVIPMVILAAVGFYTSSHEAGKLSTRYLKQRENDLRTLAENPSIFNYYINRSYRLFEEAEAYRQELERSLKRFADRANSIELVYLQVCYVNDQGEEIAKVIKDQITNKRGQVKDAPFFLAVKQLGPGEVYRSSIGPQMVYAMPTMYQEDNNDQTPTFQGAVVLDFIYPIQHFQHTQIVIARTFLIITILSLGIALFLTINRVRRLTDPIRRLADAANIIANGQRSVQVEINSKDEIGRLATSFNEMAASLEQNEAALKRKIVETRSLYEIGQEINAQVVLKPTLQLIVERAHELLQAEVSLLALRQEDSDTFTIQAYSGTVPEALAKMRIRPGEGLGGWVVATGKPKMVGDYQEEYPDSPFLEIVQEANVRSAVVVPLKARDVVTGVLYIHSRDPHKFREEDQQLLSALADHAAIAIENAKLYEQARQHAETLEAKVRERTRELEATNQELQQANLKIREADRLKSEFLANMSHELRSPMNAIIGFTRLVQRKSADVLPTKQRENLEKVEISANQLLGLINDILDLSKIEAGKMILSTSPFDLASLVGACFATVEPMVKTDRVRLVKEVPGNLPEVLSDQDKLKQIIINLLSNALKFTEEGEVKLSAVLEDSLLKIAVSDTGIGIPFHALQYIFDEFRQVDGSSTRRYGGTGLGLSITKKLTHLLGGTIDVSSVEGEGSTFTVTIPLERREDVPAEEVKTDQEVLVRAEMRGKKVLLAIDDDPNVLILLRENLEEEGYYIVGALSGDEGVQKARDLQPFAITLDILMPHKDGWEVLNDLKADPATRHIPVIVLSIIDNRELGFSLCAFDYLMKPFDKATILSALQRASRAPTNRVLVVDDEPDAVNLITQLLEDEGYQIKGAYSGEEAFHALEDEVPDIILLDLLMPQMDGFDVIQRIKTNPDWSDIPIVVVTAKDLTDADWEFLRQRVDKIIRKTGLDKETLVREVQDLLREHAASRKEDAT